MVPGSTYTEQKASGCRSVKRTETYEGIHHNGRSRTLGWDKECDQICVESIIPLQCSQT